MENGSEYRTLMKAFGIRFDVLVYGNVSVGAGGGVRSSLPGGGSCYSSGAPPPRGLSPRLSWPPCSRPAQPLSLCLQAGKFNIIPTIISSVAAFTSVGVVSPPTPLSLPAPLPHNLGASAPELGAS